MKWSATVIILLKIVGALALALSLELRDLNNHVDTSFGSKQQLKGQRSSCKITDTQGHQFELDALQFFGCILVGECIFKIIHK